MIGKVGGDVPSIDQAMLRSYWWALLTQVQGHQPPMDAMLGLWALMFWGFGLIFAQTLPAFPHFQKHFCLLGGTVFCLPSLCG